MEQKIVFELTPNEANTVLAGLTKLPLEASMELFMKLRTIAAEQFENQKQAEEAPVAE